MTVAVSVLGVAQALTWSAFLVLVCLKMRVAVLFRRPWDGARFQTLLFPFQAQSTVPEAAAKKTKSLYLPASSGRATSDPWPSLRLCWAIGRFFTPSKNVDDGLSTWVVGRFSLGNSGASICWAELHDSQCWLPSLPFDTRLAPDQKFPMDETPVTCCCWSAHCLNGS